MQPATILAIYFLFWFLSLFLVLPFGVRTAEEEGVAHVPGQADSAPARFSFWRVAMRTSILAGVLFLLFYLNYTQGWITPQSFNHFFGLSGKLVN